jgi:hypothetical protein
MRHWSCQAPVYRTPGLPNPRQILVRTLPYSPRVCLSIFLSSNRAATNVEPVRYVQISTSCPIRPLVCFSARSPRWTKPCTEPICSLCARAGNGLGRLASLLLCRHRDYLARRPSQLESTGTPPAHRCQHAARRQRGRRNATLSGTRSFLSPDTRTTTLTTAALPLQPHASRSVRCVYDSYLGSVKG